MTTVNAQDASIPGSGSAFNVHTSSAYGQLGEGLSVEPPESLVFRASTQASKSVITAKQVVRIFPAQGGQYKPGQVIQFPLPRHQYYMDTENARLVLATQVYKNSTDRYTFADLPRFFPKAASTNVIEFGQNTAIDSHWQSTDVTESGWIRFKNGVDQTISRMRLLMGAKVVEDIEDYGLLSRLLYTLHVPLQFVETQTLQAEGYGDPANIDHRMYRNWQAAETNREWVLPIKLGLFQKGFMLPLPHMEQLTIEVTVAAAAAALVTSWEANILTPVAHAAALVDGTQNTGAATSGADITAYPTYAGSSYPNATFVIDQAYILAPVYTVTKEFDTSLQSALSGKGITIFFETWYRTIRSLSAASSETFTFNDRRTSLNYCLSVFMPANSYHSLGVDGDFPSYGLREYWWRHGSITFPQEKMWTRQGSAVHAWFQQWMNGTLGDMLHDGQVKWDNSDPRPGYSSAESTMQTIASTTGRLPRTATNTQSVDYHYAYLAAGELDYSLTVAEVQNLNRAMPGVQPRAAGNFYFTNASVRCDRIPQHRLHARGTGHVDRFILAQDFTMDRNALSGINTAASQAEIMLELTKGVGHPVTFYMGRAPLWGAPDYDRYVGHDFVSYRLEQTQLRWSQMLALHPVFRGATSQNAVAVNGTNAAVADLLINTAKHREVADNDGATAAAVTTHRTNNIYKFTDIFPFPFYPGLWRENVSAHLITFWRYTAALTLFKNNTNLIF
jgi:hypothetical protein